ncbi:U-box domain-containing protein 35 [Camellia lanceoleosa]|uniref:U-box domain-containing protein 35 n=1 Tax=Camellia lanceoleosa TaxID=1840588 RepID=A0ACC0HQB7_9ERIC|nr:U-box domain-containing protein 35 [Camellia lanceoleosa]
MCNLDLWFRSKGSSSNQDSRYRLAPSKHPSNSRARNINLKDKTHNFSTPVVNIKIMEMYNSICKEAISSNEKEIDEWKPEEERKVLEAKQAQEAAMALAEMEKQKTKVAIEATLMAQRLAKYEIQMRKNAKMKAIHEVGERKKAMDALACSEIRYRKYPIKEIEVAIDYFSNSLKTGEGGYGPVYKAFLDHTPVAIKVLRSEMSQGKKQFQREVEVLSYIRHPNMVLLLGARPEYGCLVYEYMENGSLEDRLFRKNNSPPLPWKTRFRISAEYQFAELCHFNLLVFALITGNFPTVRKALLSVSSCLQDNPRAEAVNSTTPRSSGIALHGTGTKNIGANHRMVMEEEVVFKLLCQVHKVGSLIGKCGSIIRALQNETGATIKIADAASDSDERVVVIFAREACELTI